ncbi:MAG: hypothetical protein A2506_02070 [Elusimicrobia bacterium RIFOXYD12_FULL_66_9]|nr:MAG: hypothetical protein A2506_02070 [Elusimicrobia bacterium RIFOXYD12_FULL_66_9]
MRLLLPLAASFSACVSVEPLPDPRQAVAPNQRLVVLVYQSPGPWIIKESDSKAESAAKVLPVGFLVQTVQDDKTLEISRDLQQYLPRPRYDQELESALIKTLRSLHSGTVQTGAEAGLSLVQLHEWNSTKNQLDWRRRYYTPEYGAPAPRDYSKVLSLDDAAILEVNLSFGTEATDEGQIQPAVSAALRLYRASTTRLLWEREEMLTEKTSSMTLAEFKAQPRELTLILEKLAPRLGENVARAAAKALGLIPPAPPTPPAPQAGAPSALPYGLTEAEIARYGQPVSTAPLNVDIATSTVVFGTLPVEVSTPPASAP